jgi:hypothetical protein
MALTQAFGARSKKLVDQSRTHAIGVPSRRRMTRSANLGGGAAIMDGPCRQRRYGGDNRPAERGQDESVA